MSKYTIRRSSRQMPRLQFGLQIRYFSRLHLPALPERAEAVWYYLEKHLTAKELVKPFHQYNRIPTRISNHYRTRQSTRMKYYKYENVRKMRGILIKSNNH